METDSMPNLSTTRELENFGRNIRVTPAVYYEPTSELEVLEILDRHAGEKIRVVGRLHSWSPACTTQGVAVSMARLSSVELTDEEGPGSHAWVGAGIQIKHLIKELNRHGRSLPSLGLITEQTIAGAISTGTHGSGRHCLSHFAEAIQIARYNPHSGKAIVEEFSGGDVLRAAQCSLGNLGVILKVKMKCRDPYQIEEFWHPYTHLNQVLKKQEEYPLQQFFLLPWKWQYLAQHRRETDKSNSGPEWLYRIYFFLCIDLLLHSVLALMAKFSVFRALIPITFRGILANSVIKNWRVTGDSSRMLVMEQELFRHIETELFVQKEFLHRALEFVQHALEWSAGQQESPPSSFRKQVDEHGLRAEFEAARGVHCHHFPICIRRILPDNTLLSMTSGGQQDWYSISLISYAPVRNREGFFATSRFITKSMAKLFQARPHWGKYIPLSDLELTSLYPEFSKYREVCIIMDPEGRFRNEWFDRLFQQS